MRGAWIGMPGEAIIWGCLSKQSFVFFSSVVLPPPRGVVIHFFSSFFPSPEKLRARIDSLSWRGTRRTRICGLFFGILYGLAPTRMPARPLPRAQVTFGARGKGRAYNYFLPNLCMRIGVMMANECFLFDGVLMFATKPMLSCRRERCK